MTGSDPQTFGLVHAESDRAFTAHGNENWIMTKQSIDVPAGGLTPMSRRIVAAHNQGDTDPFAVLDQIVSR